MNIEIERLLRLANIKDDDGYNTTDLTTSLQLFAELIVKEGAEHILTSTDRHRREYFAESLLEHFGVDQ